LPFVPIVLALGIALMGRHFLPTPAKVELVGIGDRAPDFTLRDAQKDERAEPVTLSRLVQKGPVVVIFHIGLHCPDCAQQLLAIAARLEDFKAAGIQVVAISPETPEETRVGIENYGAFPFFLLSDPDNQVARAFGMESPDRGFLDGAFVVDQDRRIRLAERTIEPFSDLSQLLNVGTKSKSSR